MRTFSLPEDAAPDSVIAGKLRRQANKELTFAGSFQLFQEL